MADITMMTDWDESIPGGLASGRSPSDFDQHALRMGMSVEMEHTNDPHIAMEITMDHLTEDPLYYEKLKTIETHESQLRSFLRMVISESS